MVNIKYEQLSKMTNQDLLEELVHRMNNFGKYDLLLGKWNSFETSDDECYQIKIIKLEE